MKKYVLALSALTMMAFTAGAQVTDHPVNDSTAQHQWARHDFHRPLGEMRPMHRRDMMAHIRLSDAQRQQMKAINSSYSTQLKQLEQHDNITVREYRQRQAALEQERKSKMDAVLTAEQKSQIAAARKQHQQMREKMEQQRLMKMKSDLNLTDDQVAKIQDQKKASMEKARAIRENPTLTRDQKREAFRDLMKTGRADMKNILTADQLKKEKELRDSRMQHSKMMRERSAS